MNAPHWHLAINHIPVVGVFLVMLFLGYALVRSRGELYGVSLGALVLLALATVPVFFTGRSADEALMEFPDVDDKLIHGVHEAAANVAFIGWAFWAWSALGGLVVRAQTAARFARNGRSHLPPSRAGRNGAARQ